ncbi:MAG: GTP-binding protein [Candidatus Hydrothermarchaeota archaeon]
MLSRIAKKLTNLFVKKPIRIGIYGPPNAGKTTLANRIAKDWTGKEVGEVSVIPHETKHVQKKERIVIKAGGKELLMNILDMPGIDTKVDYRKFMEYGLDEKEAQERARDATKGVIEAIKWLDHVDAVLAVMDSADDPFTQVNLTLIGNLEARDIPIIIVANKTDLPNANPGLITSTFPQHKVVPISALNGENLDALYEAIVKYLS